MKNVAIRKFIIPMIMGASIITLSACGEEVEVDYIAKAQSAYEDNKFQNARIHLLNKLREHPTDFKANSLYAQVMLKLSDGDSAQTALEKLPDDYENLRALKAHALIIRGRAIDVLNQYKNIDSAEYSDQDWRMIIWAKFNTNRLDESLEDIEVALKKHPKSTDLLVLHGKYHLAKSKNSKALEFANEALKHSPENYDALNLAARAALRLQKIDEAQGFYEKAASIFPDNPTPIINLAGIAMDKSDLETAGDYVEQAERLNSSLPLTKFIKARYANKTGDNLAAKEILQDSKSGLDEFGPAIFLSGKVAYELGEHTYATSRLQRSLVIDPTNQEARHLIEKMSKQ